MQLYFINNQEDSNQTTIKSITFYGVLNNTTKKEVTYKNYQYNFIVFVFIEIIKTHAK